jgi:type I restriction enzyme S subunit
VYVIKPNQDMVDSKFLLFYLNSLQAIKEYSKKIVGSPVCSIPMSELKKLTIPLPTMSEQKRIVSILNSFDQLINDISVGLPAELKARRSQYEYYRGKLLTFNEYVS